MNQPYRIVITADAKPAIDALAAIDRNSQRTADTLATATRLGVGFGIVGPALLGVGRSAITAADNLTSLTSRLALVTGSTQAAVDVQARLFDIAQSSRVNFVELGSTYTTVARSAAALGISQDRVLRVTESIGQAMALSGGSAQGMQAALVQLSQGLGAGALRGEELNSILEQAPRLAQALAEGLGVPIGRLRALGEAGELTTDKVVTALEKAGPQLARELAQSTTTVGQAMTVLSNSATRLVGDANNATGATNSLAQAIVAVSRGVEGVGSVIRENQGAFQVLAGAAAGAVGLAAVGAALGGIKVAVAGIAAVAAANPVVLAILGIGGAVGVGVSIYRQRAAEAETLAGKIRELNELTGATPYKNSSLTMALSGTFGNDEVRLRRIAQLRTEIAQAQAEAFRQFRAGERDTTPNPGPFPTAKSIDDARKLAAIDLDVRRKYQADLTTLNQSFAQAIARESDPNARAALERELVQRRQALAAAFQKKTAPAAPKVAEADRYLETLQRQAVTARELTAAERALEEIQSGRLGRVNAAQREQILTAARLVDANKATAAVAGVVEGLEEQARKVRELTTAENALADARQRAGRPLTADEEARIRLLSAEVDATRKATQAAEDRKRTLDNLLGATTTAKANALWEQLQLLNEELMKAEPGRYQQVVEAIDDVQRQLMDLAPRAAEARTAMSTFAEQAARNIQDGLGDTLYQTLRGNFDNILDMWIDLLIRMAAQAQAARLGETLFGQNGQNLVGMIARFFNPGAPANASGSAPTGGSGLQLPTAVRGGAATGTNVLQRDMITLVHKGEAIVPPRYNPSLGGSRVTVNNYAGAQVETRQRDDGSIDIDVLTRNVEARIAGNVGAARGPMSSALRARGLNSSTALPRIG